MQDDTSPDSLAIPPALLAEIQAEADEERRPAADVLREVIERGLGQLRWKAHSETELQRARELGLPDAHEDLPMTDEYRQAIREMIAQGLASARQGKLVDGPSVFARIRAEMAEIERQSGR